MALGLSPLKCVPSQQVYEETCSRADGPRSDLYLVGISTAELDLTFVGLCLTASISTATGDVFLL